MGRFASTLQKDVMVQSRKNFYSVSIMVALVFAAIFTFILKPEYLGNVIPATLLFVVGATTIVFIGALLMEEKELGLINAFTVTPLSTKTYLGSKVFSLTFLATLEVTIMIGIPIAWHHSHSEIALPNIPLLLFAVTMLNLLYVLFGIVLSVRFNKLTDYMMPIVAVMIILQIPILYYSGIIESKLLLIIPSAGPVMLVNGAFNNLDMWEWGYGFGYTIALVITSVLWAHNAFNTHVIQKTR